MKSMEYQWSHESVGPINKLKPYAEVTLQLIVVHIGAKKDEDACHKVVHFIFLCSDHIAKLPLWVMGTLTCCIVETHSSKVSSQ